MGPPPLPLQQDPQFQHRQLRPPYSSPDSLRSYSEPYTKLLSVGIQDQIRTGTAVTRTPLGPPLKLLSTPSSSAAPARQGKTRFNLRNPMSLLARRRSHQAVVEAKAEKEQYKSAYPPVPSLPEDFDPRIRGKVVHDFSAPRPGTNKSLNSVRDSERYQREALLYNSRKISPNPSTAFIDEDSPGSSEREHTPQFKEHFDDDMGLSRDSPAKKRTSAFMYQVSLSESQPDPDPSVLPPFARHLPWTIRAAAPAVPEASTPPPKKSLEIVPETSCTDTVPTEKSSPSTAPTPPPVKPRSRASSSADSPYQPAGLPNRFKSNASRFSFDLAGKGSAAQEKILEEKHRENERKKARRSDDSRSSEADIADDDDDEYGYNDLDDDDGLEEKIPGVNADAEEPNMLDAQQYTQDVDFITPNTSSYTSAPSLASTGITLPNTPRDSMDPRVHLVGGPVSPWSVHEKDVDGLQPDLKNEMMNARSEGGYVNHQQPAPGSKHRVDVSEVYLLKNEEDDGDLYFDDGMIDDVEVQEEHAFDESVFDDDTSKVYGLPLRDRRPSQTLLDTGHQQDCSIPPRAAGSVVYAPQHTGGMADLAAYHDALAVKVTQAALNGEFARRLSLDAPTEGIAGSDTGPSQANASFSGPRDRLAGGLLMGGGIDDDGDDFNIDDALADDPIIAAANAEALENDDEGFYGQEFGFFARASSAGEAEYANGGYFGSRGFEGIGRSHSGRVNEPSLTPITERSEWSNRNSAISLAMHGFQLPPAGPQPSPGLAQLADMMHLEEDDMSLSALMKLRRGAWGGSTASLHSSSSGSPLTYVPGVGFPGAVPMQQSNSAHTLASSSYSSNGLSSSNDDSPASATVTFSTQQQALPIPPYASKSQLPQRRSLSPVKRSSMGPPPKPNRGHSRNGSNASESVSYVHEMGDEDGGPGRWVLEKRRVDESGVVEVLGREIVEGGRI